jgi:hypothetical protein
MIRSSAHPTGVSADAPGTETTDRAPLLISVPQTHQRALPSMGSESIRRLVEQAPPTAVEVGDIVIVQCSGAPCLNLDGQRTFEIRHRKVDDLRCGRVGIGSELGAILRDCLVDDCVSFTYQSFEVTIVVVGIRKGQPL